MGVINHHPHNALLLTPIQIKEWMNHAFGTDIETSPVQNKIHTFRQ